MGVNVRKLLDWKTLFITDHHCVYRARVNIAGIPVW